MGWKSTLRSMKAASNRAERAERQRQREYQRRQKEYAKMVALEQANYEIAVHENQIECLISIHKECSESLDWSVLQTKDLPQTPTPRTTHQHPYKQALHKFESSPYGQIKQWTKSQPKSIIKFIAELVVSILDLIYEPKLKQLQNNLREAAQLDTADHKFEVKLHSLVKKVMNGDVEEAYVRIIQHVNPFSEIQEMGSRIIFTTQGAQAIEATITVHDEQVIPPERKTLLKSGKVSCKKWTKGQFYELYQDHVCAVVLRIARELFALLPIDTAIITAQGNILNTTTGHKEIQPILSAMIPRTTLESLNFETLDPSDSMRNFKHHMIFKKTKGFTAVEVIEIPKPTMKITPNVPDEGS